MTQDNDERINRYSQRIVEASEKMMPKAEGEPEEGRKRRKQAESTAADQQMHDSATGSQDPNGSKHRGRKRGEEEQAEERPGKWRK